MTQRTVAQFLTPEGFTQPALGAVVREASLVREVGRYARLALAERAERRRAPYAGSRPVRSGEPVLLVPGFLAGDGTLAGMSRSLEHRGFRTFRSEIRANVGCTLDAANQLEERLEQVAHWRGSRVRIVGHSLGGILARGVAARRPDLVAGIITMGSPTLAPGAHHVTLSRSVDMLVRLSRAGVRGLMAEDCVAGACARESFERAQAPLSSDVDYTAIYSRRDGVIDWRAAADPLAHTVEVTSSHVGMAVDPQTIEAVVRALRFPAPASAVEVDRGEIA